MISTPIWDFARDYAERNPARFHMPGHKGKAFLGCEDRDLTEIEGADDLYHPAGIIAESEANASKLFGWPTVYSTEGSSLCVRAMLALAYTAAGRKGRVLAGRNAHKTFLSAAILLDFPIRWLWAGEDYLSCPVTPEQVERAILEEGEKPFAVYLTSPDYLGNIADIRGISRVCGKYGVRLLVDNAHGAYLKFLPESRHPMDLGADLCCDSAHKTLPVLTGGAYLHFREEGMRGKVKDAMALFGSTSPSYLTLASLDRCNRYLAEDYRSRLAETVARLDGLKARLEENGWKIYPSDPLKLTIDAAASGTSGQSLGARLRQGGVECEYADPAFLVLMATPENTERELARVLTCLGANCNSSAPLPPLPVARGTCAMSVRQALFSPHETIPASRSLGRICAAPTVSCPPAIPIAVSGERIGPEALTLFAHYGVPMVDVVKEVS